ncbi:hypothetical protein GTZ78_35735 [Streptomyces sp. SID8361]|nr:hypothetical protein [Streptomyces sp. SID8361]
MPDSWFSSRHPAPQIAVPDGDTRGSSGTAPRRTRPTTASGQWLDIGTGIPTKRNPHEVAQSVAPDARIVHVDNDPIVLVHAQTLLNSSAEGRTRARRTASR